MRRFVVLASLLFVTLALSGCDFAIQQALYDTQELANSEDPGVRAAADSPEAIRIDREAREHFSEGLARRDPAEIAKAIELRPLDIRYRAHQLALLLAYEDEPRFQAQRRQSFAEVVAILNNVSPTGKMTDAERLYFYSYYLPALQEWSNKFDPEAPEGKAIEWEACSVRQVLGGSGLPLAQKILADNPFGVDCEAILKKN
jgi:hypothetical protein